MKSNYTDLQLQHQQQMKDKRESLRLRKARTHRLIIRGAIAEGMIPGSAEMTDQQFQQALYSAIHFSVTPPSHPQDSAGRPSQERPPEGACGSNPR